MSVDFYGKKADGSPVMLGHSHAHNLNMSNVNARMLLSLLELPFEDHYGEAPLPVVRRAIIKVNALFDKRVGPHERSDYLRRRLIELSETTEALAELGATQIYWA